MLNFSVPHNLNTYVVCNSLAHCVKNPYVWKVCAAVIFSHTHAYVTYRNYSITYSLAWDSDVLFLTHMPMSHISCEPFFNMESTPIVNPVFCAVTQKLSCFCERPQPQGKSLEAQVLAGLSSLFNQFVISFYAQLCLNVYGLTTRRCILLRV